LTKWNRHRPVVKCGFAWGTFAAPEAFRQFNGMYAGLESQFAGSGLVC
jgi:hypothetical protein